MLVIKNCVMKFTGHHLFIFKHSSFSVLFFLFLIVCLFWRSTWFHPLFSSRQHSMFITCGAMSYIRKNKFTRKIDYKSKCCHFTRVDDCWWIVNRQTDVIHNVLTKHREWERKENKAKPTAQHMATKNLLYIQVHKILIIWHGDVTTVLS